MHIAASFVPFVKRFVHLAEGWFVLFCILAAVTLHHRKLHTVGLLRHHCLKAGSICAGRKEVVRVNKCYAVACSHIKSAVAGSAETAVLPAVHHPYPRIATGKRVAQASAAVGRAVVDKDYLHIVDFLRHDTVDAFAQKCLHTINWYDHT